MHLYLDLDLDLDCFSFLWQVASTIPTTYDYIVICSNNGTHLNCGSKWVPSNTSSPQIEAESKNSCDYRTIDCDYIVRCSYNETLYGCRSMWVPLNTYPPLVDSESNDSTVNYHEYVLLQYFILLLILMLKTLLWQRNVCLKWTACE